jgi:predicted dehydrogenase
MVSLHAWFLTRSARAELAGIVDPRQVEGEALALRFTTMWTPDIQKLRPIDGAIIAAATEAHFEIAMNLLDEGIPLLIEKPLAAGLAETLQILEKSAQLGVPVMCGLLERFNPAIITARALMDQPLHITATRHSPFVPRIRTGVGWDLLVHDVDLAINLFGSSPIGVEGMTGSFHPGSASTSEDVAEVVLGFEGGGIAHVSASRIGQRKIRAMTIHELDKSIEVDLLRRDVTVYRHVSDQPASADGRGYRQQTVIEIPELLTSEEPLSAQLNHFVGLLDGTFDPGLERESIIPSHRVVQELMEQRALV